MINDFDDELELIAKYNPDEYMLRICDLIDAHEKDLTIEITKFDTEIIICKVLFVTDWEVKILIDLGILVDTKTLPISEIQYTKIRYFKEDWNETTKTENLKEIEMSKKKPKTNLMKKEDPKKDNKPAKKQGKGKKK